MHRRPPPDALCGIELRFVLVVLLLDAERPLSVGELAAAVDAMSVPLRGRTSKVVSDALRWELPKGRVRRLARNRYTIGTMPRSTEWWIRTRARSATERLSLQRPAA